MKKRVLYLEHSTDGTIGGSHLCLLEICRHLDREQYEPVVVFFERNALIDEFENSGAEIIVLNLPANWSAPSIVPFPIARVMGFIVNLIRTVLVRSMRWKTLLQQRKIDLVHINNACGYDHDLMLASRLAGIPCIVHERGIQESIDSRTRYFANRVDRIIAISDAVAENMTKQGIALEKIVRIDDGIDESRFREIESADTIRHRLGLSKSEPVIGIVGNIKYWKGQHVVIEAVGALIRDYPQLRCLFVGSKADKGYCDNLVVRARELGIPGTAVLFTGYEPHPADLMRAMDVVIHASVQPEPFGIVLLEAMGAARPLVATNLGGPKEIVLHGETGILVPPGDAHALAEGVKKLLSNLDEARRMGERGQRRFYERYTIQNNLALIENLYSQITINR